MVRAESGIAPSHIMYLDVGELQLVDVGSPVDAWGLRERAARPLGPSGGSGSLAGGGARVGCARCACGVRSAHSWVAYTTTPYTCGRGEVSVVGLVLSFTSTPSYAPVISGRECVLHEQLSRRSVPADPSAFTLNSALSLIRHCTLTCHVDRASSGTSSMIVDIEHALQGRPPPRQVHDGLPHVPSTVATSRGRDDFFSLNKLHF